MGIKFNNISTSRLKKNIIPIIDLNFVSTNPSLGDFSITRSSTATYIDSDSVIQTAVVDEVRFEHDFNTFVEPLGLLVEEARTNHALHSEVF